MPRKNAQRMGFENTHYEAGRAEDIILSGTRKVIVQML